MNIGLRIFQGLLTVGEIYLGYCFIGLLVDGEYVRKKRNYIVLCSILIGVLTTYNREVATVVSWTLLVLQSTEVCLSLIKLKKGVFVFGTVFSYNVCAAALQMCFTFVLAVIFPKAAMREIYYEMSGYRVLCYTLTMAVLLLMYGIVHIMCRKYPVDLEDYKWTFCVYGMIGVMCVVIFQIQFVTYGELYGKDNLLFVFIICVMLVTTIVILVISMRNAGIRADLRFSEMKNQMYEENYREIKAIYDNFAFVNHDMKNHFIVVERYCRKKEMGKALKYIEKVKRPLFQVGQYIQSGNEVMDVILNFKLSEAEKKGIRIQTEVDSLKGIRMEEHDICAIMSNLLDNAIEGCRSVEDGNQKIQVLVKVLGEMLYINVLNTCGEQEKQQEDERKGVHGYGLKSVKGKVERYHGNVVWEKKENWFIVTVNILNVGGTK